MHSATFEHIAALHEQLEEAAIDKDPVVCLEIALLILDVYEQLLEDNCILRIDRGETFH